MLDFLYIMVTGQYWFVAAFVLGFILLIGGLVTRFFLSNKYKQSQIRKQKEDEAWGEYFFVGFHKSFDDSGAVINRFGPDLTYEGRKFMQKVDKITDSWLLDKTEEIRNELD